MTSSSMAASDELRVLKNLGCAPSLSEFIQHTKGRWSTLQTHLRGGARQRLLQQSLTPLLITALANGLKLYIAEESRLDQPSQDTSNSSTDSSTASSLVVDSRTSADDSTTASSSKSSSRAVKETRRNELRTGLRELAELTATVVLWVDKWEEGTAEQSRLAGTVQAAGRRYCSSAKPCFWCNSSSVMLSAGNSCFFNSTVKLSALVLPEHR